MNAIVAANNDWGISFCGAQTIVIPGDRRRFRMLTNGGVLISGRRTFESLPGPLPNRRNIVLTRDRAFVADGVIITYSKDEALAEIAGDDPDKVFVIGGGDIYRLFLPLCKCVYVTRIYITPRSDVFFPDLDSLPEWSLVRREFGTWYPESGIDANTEQGLQCQSASCNGEGSGIRYSFDIYKNKTLEEIYV